MIVFPPLSDLQLYPPASPEQLNTVEENLKLRLPDVLISLLLQSNGLHTNSCCVFGTDDLEERNRSLEVSTYASGYLAIGDDHGGRVYLQKADVHGLEVYSSDAGDLNPADFQTVSDHLALWVSSGFRLPTEARRSVYSLVLSNMPPQGLKDLIALRSELALNLTIGELRQQLQGGPVKLVRNLDSKQAHTIVEKLAHRNIPVDIQHAGDIPV